MTLENNHKILIGSIMSSIDKRLILGEGGETSVILLSLLVSHLEYSLEQQKSNAPGYNKVVQELYAKILALKHKCSDICVYKNRLIYLKDNTAPNIEDNIIEVPFGELSSHPYNEVIHRYNDAENNLISQVVVLEVGESHTFFVDHAPSVVDNIYTPSVEFSSVYNLDEDYLYLIKNTDTAANIIKVEKQAFESASLEGEVLEVKEIEEEIVFQILTNSVQTLPNDTLIYIHIDTSSMTGADQISLENTALLWWEQFKLDTPEFEGSLIINTVNHATIDPTGFASGRDAPGNIPIVAETALDNMHVEAWLNTPSQALLRQAYKEGETTFNTIEEYVEFISGRSVITLAFVDETNSAYHSSQRELSNQPTDSYRADYDNFVEVIAPNLNFFKGVLYPITRIFSATPDSFMIHAISAIEGRNLTEAEFKSLLGPEKAEKYEEGGSTIHTDLVNAITGANPYLTAGLTELKNLNWEGVFTKYSPSIDPATGEAEFELFSAEEFSQELDALITDVSTVETTTIKTFTVPAENLGGMVSDSILIKVKDNHPTNPLYSDPAEVTVNYVAEAEEEPACGRTSNLEFPHQESYTFSAEDLLTSEEDRILLEGVAGPGELRFQGYKLTGSNFPVVVTRERLASGDLSYTFTSSSQEVVDIAYKTAFTGSYNHCEDNYNSVTITKLGDTTT